MDVQKYDAWRLAGPDDGIADIGTAYGESCGRYAEPDEDAPRGWKPKPCNGEMVDDGGGAVVCNVCFEVVECEQ